MVTLHIFKPCHHKELMCSAFLFPVAYKVIKQIFKGLIWFCISLVKGMFFGLSFITFLSHDVCVCVVDLSTNFWKTNTLFGF